MGGPAGRPGWKPPTAVDIMAKFDKKKDGKLTKDEVPPRLWEGFTKAGVVQNGVVTKQGVETALKKLREHYRPGGPAAKPQAGPAGGPNRPGLSLMFHQWDKKKNGKLTKDEVPAEAWQHFQRLGAVKDGVVTMQSLTDAFKKRQRNAEEAAKAAKPQAGPSGPHAGWQGGPNRPNMPSSAKPKPAGNPMWDYLTKMGAVQNGVVTKESLEAAMKKRQAERQKQ
jgi:hypothetical protein